MSDEQVQVVRATPVSTGFTTSAEIGNLVEALAKAHQSFKPVLKDATNPFFKSKYADLAGVIEATSDSLSNNGLVIVQSPRLTDSRVAVTTLLAHSSGQWIRDVLELPLSKFDAQGVGSATTYARRYSYQAMVGVAAEDDDGCAASPQTFKKQEDGSFAKAINTPNPPSTVTGTGKLPSTENVQKPKPVARKKATEDPNKQPWGGQAGQSKSTDFPFGENQVPPAPRQEQTANPQTAPASYNSPNAVTPENPITDSDLPDNLQGSRLATDAERKNLTGRCIALKDKGYVKIREFLMKESGQDLTNNIPYAQFEKLVARMEAAEAAGTLKELLSR